MGVEKQLLKNAASIIRRIRISEYIDVPSPLKSEIDDFLKEYRLYKAITDNPINLQVDPGTTPSRRLTYNRERIK